MLVWDSVGTQVDLLAAGRASDTAAWSAPVTLASDTTLAHRPVVGMFGDDGAIVAYLHDAGAGAQAETRRAESGAWAAPVEHSTAPVKQVDLAVSGDGDALLAWSQQQDGQVNLHARRYLSSGDAWDAPQQLSDHLATDGLLDVSLSAKDALAATFLEDGGTRQIQRVALGFPDSDPCPAACPVRWHFQNLAPVDNGSRASGVLHGGGERPWLVESLPDHTGGHEIAYLQGNGSDSYLSDVSVSDGGDNDDVRVGLGRRLAVTWTKHTSDGDVRLMRTLDLALNGRVAGRYQHVLGDSPVPAVPATSYTRDASVLWVDVTSGAPVLRSLTDDGSNESPIVEAGYAAVDRGDDVVGGPAETDGTTYDVRTRQATPRQDFGSAQVWKSRTTQTSATYHAARGRTVCFSSRSYATGAASAWSGDRCTTVALDDRSLDASHWTRQRGSAYYAGTRLTTRRDGARLSLSSVRARTVALLVSRRPGNGRIRVSLGGHRLATVSTAGARGDRVVVPVSHFRTVHRGRLVLTVVGSGRSVSVDGVFLGAR